MKVPFRHRLDVKLRGAVTRAFGRSRVRPHLAQPGFRLASVAKASQTLSLFLWLLLVEACAIYQPMPLDSNAVTAKLAPPNLETVQLRAKNIQHPILKPLDFDISNGLSPDEAAILAVVASPKLRAIRDQKGIAAAQLLQSGVLPNPQISYGLDIPTAGATHGTVNAFNVGLNWEITSLVSRDARVAAARADAASVDLDTAWQEWQAAEGAKLQAYHLYFFDQQLAVAKQEEQALSENLGRVKRGAELGLVTVVDLAAAEAAVQRMHATVLTTEQQREHERLTLNESLGFPGDDLIPLEQNIALPDVKALPSVDALTEGLEGRRLDLLALRSGYQSEEEKLRAAVLSQFPKISIGFAHAGDTTNVITTGFGVTIDLPLFDRNQGGIAIENATRSKLYDEYVARLFEARGDIARAIADMKSLQRQIDAAQASVLILQNVVDSYRRALLQGNADVLTYYNARGDLITRRMEIFDLKRQLTDLDVALEIAAGESLGGSQTKGATP
jgi:outer membrane protein, heavy metal efflux system